MSVPTEYLKAALQQVVSLANNEAAAVDSKATSVFGIQANVDRLGREQAYRTAAELVRTMANLSLRPEQQIQKEDIEPKL